MSNNHVMMFIKKHLLLTCGVVIGSLLGYAYYYWIGCTSGACPITSNPANSTLYGALMGGLLINMFKKNK